MLKRNYFRWRGVKVAAAGTNEIAFPRVEPKRQYHIARVAVENETTASTDVRILVRGHGWDHYEMEQDSPAAATLYWDSDPIELSEGEDLVAKWTGATANDRLVFYVSGWWVEEARDA